MLSKANTSLPLPLVQDLLYKYVPLRSTESHTTASYVVNHATSELEIHSNLLQKSKRVNTFPRRVLSGLLEKVITLNNLGKRMKGKLERGRNRLQRLRQADCGSKVSWKP